MAESAARRIYIAGRCSHGRDISQSTCITLWVTIGAVIYTITRSDSSASGYGVGISKRRPIVKLQEELQEEYESAEARSKALEEASELKDRAVEHGGYLATAAETYLDARNKLDMAEAGYLDDEVPDTDALSDCHQALRSAIYEFRKRVERLKAESLLEKRL